MYKAFLAIVLSILLILLLGACSSTDSMSTKFSCDKEIIVEKTMSISDVAKKTLPSETWDRNLGGSYSAALQDWTALIIARSGRIGASLQPGTKVSIPTICGRKEKPAITMSSG